MIILVNAKLQLFIFDQNKIKHEVLSHNAENMNPKDMSLIYLNLIEDSRFFEQNLLKQDD